MRDPAKVIAFCECELDFGRGELRYREKPVDIQPTPLRVLLYLAEHRDRIVSRQELLDTIWPGVVVGDEALTTALAEARHADLSLRWDHGDEGAWAELYVNNLEDRRKLKSSLYNRGTHRQWFLAAPRMVGFRVGWSWSSEESPFARLGAASD